VLLVEHVAGYRGYWMASDGMEVQLILVSTTANRDAVGVLGCRRTRYVAARRCARRAARYLGTVSTLSSTPG
jgi:4'-phosphopantetheinyl transferase EntD